MRRRLHRRRLLHLCHLLHAPPRGRPALRATQASCVGPALGPDATCCRRRCSRRPRTRWTSQSHAARGAVVAALAQPRGPAPASAAAGPRSAGPFLRGVLLADPAARNLQRRGCPFRWHPTRSCASALPRTARTGLGPRSAGLHWLGRGQARLAARNRRCRLGS
ncbi:hypothetical protein PF006_g11403 [Phytophthora fragariae]|uniref:Uncharacterized protein n=1 Tax=Phytophthora fragariae TaxID=53985 RepID=A0A6A3TZ12_9STRA|nr:hypothetical protein PF003_g8929 [Phytophthora fragariae]KAE9143593.1 hypothetical protein PF006_g11403 [Phytophthora fragariae]